jgi:transcriptional regulator with XRE-family HTH domain
MTLDEVLRRARLEARLSQRELAQEAGVTQATVARIERGQTSPRYDTVVKLLRVCSVELMPRRLEAGLGVDRTAIRELLRLSPAERLRRAAEDARGLESLLRASRHRADAR